jgi:Ankyrin repeats (3 copies)
VVKRVVDRWPGCLEAKEHLGWTPLHVGCQGAPLEVVRYLVEKRELALQAPTNDGWLPLHLVAHSAPPEEVRYLAQAWAPALRNKNPSGVLPLHVAAQFAPLEVVQVLADLLPEALLVETNMGARPIVLARNNAKRPDVADWLEAATRRESGGKGECGGFGFGPWPHSIRRWCWCCDGSFARWMGGRRRGRSEEGAECASSSKPMMFEAEERADRDEASTRSSSSSSEADATASRNAAAA